MNQKRAKQLRKLLGGMFESKPADQTTKYIEVERNRKFTHREDPTTGTKKTLVTPGTVHLSTECERGQYKAIKKALS